MTSFSTFKYSFSALSRISSSRSDGVNSAGTAFFFIGASLGGRPFRCAANPSYPFIFPLIQEATVNSCCIGGSFTRCSCHDFGYQLILFFRCPYFVLILVLQCIRTARFLYSGPPLNHFMKVLLLDAIWRLRPFSFPIHFYTHSLVLIAVFHIAIPPILGVQYWGYISYLGVHIIFLRNLRGYFTF